MKYSLLIIFIAFLACKNNKPVTQQTETKDKPEMVSNSTDNTQKQPAVPIETIPPPAKTDTTTRLVLFFYSVASGIEFDLMNEMIDSVGTYSKNLGKTIEYKKIPWGREGETDVTFKLKELTPAEQSDFVTMIRRVLKKGKLVTIYENYPYKHRGR